MNSDTLYEYTDSYVAFLDILGFKNLITKMSCRQIVDLFQRMKNPLSKMYLGTSIEVNVSEVEIKVMSDSICFHIGVNRNDALLSIIAACQAFQSELLGLDSPVILRGAIVRGYLYQNEDITFGPGLIDAYLLEENEAKYPRIIIKEEVLNDVIDSIEDRISDRHSYILHILYSMIYAEEIDGKRVSCIDYMKAYENSDTYGTSAGALFDYVNNQIEHLTDEKRDKWQYVKNQILRFYKPENCK